jgi:DNA-directed RNA polymerase subunit RPC12/RpoP
VVRHVADEDEAGDDGWDDDFGSDDENEPTVPCPYCRREIFEGSPRCPHCGQYIFADDSPPMRKPWWIIVGVLLCLAAIWVWIASR